MTKTYVTPFNWDYVDDKSLIYNKATTEEEIREMIGQALDEALDDAISEAVDGAVDEAINNMDIRLDGEDLLYKLIVNGNENGEINIPKDQFLKSTSYDSENKKLVFVMETADGEVTTEVSMSDLVSSIESGVGEIQGEITQINEKNEAQDTAIANKADASALDNLATKAEVEAVDAKVDAIVIPDVTELATKEELENAIAPLAVKAEVTEEINSAVDGLNAATADKADKTELETLATKAEVEAVDAKVEALEIPSIEGLAVASEVTAEIAAAVADKADVSALDNLATKAEVEAVDAKVDALEIPSIEGLAKSADVTAEIAAAVEPLATKQEVSEIEAKVDAIVIPDVSELASKEEVQAVDAKVDGLEIPSIEGLAKSADVTAEIAAAVEPLATKEEVNLVDAKVDALEIPSIEGLAVASEVTAEIAAAVENKADKSELEPLATKEELANKVDWVESTPDRKHIVLKNHDSVLGTATDGQTYNVAMVSKWDVADFGSAQLHLNLNSKDGVATINDDKVIATEGFVADSIANAIEPLATKSEIADKANVSQIPTRTSELVNDSNFITSHQSLEEYAKKTFVSEQIAEIVGGAPETLDTLKEIADALQDNATMAMVSEAISTKANAEDVYDKTEVYNKQESEEMFQASGDYVPVEDYNALAQKVAALENYVNIFIKDREEKMDEIINNMDADNKEVVIETPMESIVVPETTVAYTITAPLADNSTVELTSPKYMTLFNTSEEPVSTSIGHTFVEGESTSATSVYLVGNFDTLTLENVSPAVKSGYDAASVNNVVITENNVKNLTLALDIQDGATITNNSNANITIQDKNDLETTLTIVAPNSTVTLNGSNYEVVNATVSDNTLVIKKNVGHIGTLNVSKGNVIVEVARQSLIADKIDKYTLADGYTIDYLHDEIDSTNVSNLAKEGTHTLVDDVTKSGNFSVGMFSTDDIIWDLNGHSITSSNTRGYGIFTLRGTAKLEINDTVGTGVVKNTADEYGFWTSTVGSKVVINGGHFEASTHVLYAQKGTIEVNGGSFRLTNEDTADKDEFGNFKFLVNCHDEDYVSGDAKIIIRGGKFYGWNPSASYGEPGGPVSFVAEGYGVVESTEMIDGVEHKVFEVKPINE